MKLVSAEMSGSHAAGPEVAKSVHRGLFREIFLVAICGRSLQSQVITGVQMTRPWLLIREVCQCPARFVFYQSQDGAFKPDHRFCVLHLNFRTQIKI